MRRLFFATLLVALGVAGCSTSQPRRAGSASDAAASEPRQYRVGYRQGGLEEQLGKRIDAGECKVTQTCGALSFVDCGIAFDEAGYYVETATGAVLEVCGGACMAGPRENLCVACPPPEWTCR